MTDHPIAGIELGGTKCVATLATADGAFDKRYSDDGLHPSAAGYAVMAPLARAAVAR